MLTAFTIATVMLCPVAIRAFTIRERKYSVLLPDGTNAGWSGGGLEKPTHTCSVNAMGVGCPS